MDSTFFLLRHRRLYPALSAGCYVSDFPVEADPKVILYPHASAQKISSSLAINPKMADASREGRAVVLTVFLALVMDLLGAP